MEPVGILNAWTTQVRTKSARMTATTIDSKYSRTVDLRKPVMRLPHSRDATSVAPSLRALSHFQHRQERLLRNLDPADPLHAPLPFLLFFEQLALAGDVAAVALGQDVLAQRLDRFARDDAAPNGR